MESLVRLLWGPLASAEPSKSTEDLSITPFKVQDGLYLAWSDVAEAKLHFQDKLQSTRFEWMLSEQESRGKQRERETSPPAQNADQPSKLANLEESLLEAGTNFRPCKFGDISAFCFELHKIWQANPSETLVICTSRRAKAIVDTTFLVASYMILFQESTVDEAHSLLPPSAPMMAAASALHHARSLKWIDLPADLKQSLRVNSKDDSMEEDRIFLDEYIHYDDVNTADMHILVPGKLLAFTSPINIHQIAIPGCGEYTPKWKDADGRRRFSPEYFADIFDEFKVTVVVRGTRIRAHYDEIAFTTLGIHVEALGGITLDGSPGSCQNFRDMDRFLTLAKVSGGYMAIECGEEGLGQIDVLVSTFLMQKYGLSACKALSWCHIMHPGQTAGLQSPERRLLLKVVRDLERPSGRLRRHSLILEISPARNGAGRRPPAA